MYKLINHFNVHLKKSVTLGIPRYMHKEYFGSDEEIMENDLGKFMTIGINLPDTKNILTESALEKLCESIQNFDSNDEIHTAILHGSGGNFCRGKVASKESEELCQKLMKILHSLKKPIIAALDGYTIDFGLYLAMMCDIRVMEKTALAGFKDKSDEFQIPSFLYERLILTVGLGNAIEMLCTRQTWVAAEWQAMGFINKTVDIGCALGRSISIAQNIGFSSPLKKAIEEKSKTLSFLSTRSHKI